LKELAGRISVRDPERLKGLLMSKSQGWRLNALLVLAILVLGFSSCARKVTNQPTPRPDAASYAKEIESWRAQRLDELKSEGGWLSLIGLFWLNEGRNTFGSDGANDIVLPKGKVPPRAGAFVLTNGVVTFESDIENGFTVDDKPADSLRLKTDADGKPTLLRLRSLTFQFIRRGEKIGLRVKDRENPDRVNFGGLDFYSPDLNWRVDARFERYNPPKSMPIMNVLGMESGETSPGAIVFEVNGKTYRLDAMTEKGEPKLFMIFADATSGKETYGAGRYLYVDPPDASDRVVIDFNKSHSPPCAFTNYATCPLPPRQNILPVAIEAGEKYAKHVQ
jgi:uncharacterized protein (DUF1684 family)